MNKKYTQEDKKQVLTRCRSQESVKDIPKIMNISRSTLYDWLKKYEQENPKSQLVKMSNYNAILRENKRLKEIIAILKFVNCTLSSPLQNKNGFPAFWQFARLLLPETSYTEMILNPLQRSC